MLKINHFVIFLINQMNFVYSVLNIYHKIACMVSLPRFLLQNKCKKIEAEILPLHINFPVQRIISKNQ